MYSTFLHLSINTCFPSPGPQVVLQYTLELVLGFIVPYPVIVCSYVCILRRIRQTKFRRRVRSEKLILAIVVTFCIFWLPYHVVNLVQVGGGAWGGALGGVYLVGCSGGGGGGGGVGLGVGCTCIRSYYESLGCTIN